MNDVAARAGVSQSTVSFVLNNREEMRIAPETRQRVLDTVEELGFRLDLNARALRLKATHTIGVLTDEIATTPFAGRLLQGGQDEALANDRMLMIVNIGLDERFKESAIDALLDRRVDGMIYAAQSPHEVRIPSRMAEMSTVLINCFADPASQLPDVLPDERHGGRLATSAALDAGHRDMVYFAGTESVWATGERLVGHLGALRAAGVPSAEADISYGTYLSDSGYERAIALKHRKKLPTAILCGNDRIALGVLFALRDLGLSVPGDISVIGYDDQEYLAEATHPALTTVALPHYELGLTGVRTMVAALAGHEVPAHQSVRGDLVVRASLTAPRLS